ncbi:MAG: hypothetical protein WBA93_09015, partial [Microcoleaceae cyanobacterium]
LAKVIHQGASTISISSISTLNREFLYLIFHYYFLPKKNPHQNLAKVIHQGASTIYVSYLCVVIPEIINFPLLIFAKKKPPPKFGEGYPSGCI